MVGKLPPAGSSKAVVIDVLPAFVILTLLKTGEIGVVKLYVYGLLLVNVIAGALITNNIGYVGALDIGIILAPNGMGEVKDILLRSPVNEGSSVLLLTNDKVIGVQLFSIETDTSAPIGGASDESSFHVVTHSR